MKSLTLLRIIMLLALVGFMGTSQASAQMIWKYDQTAQSNAFAPNLREVHMDEAVYIPGKGYTDQGVLFRESVVVGVRGGVMPTTAGALDWKVFGVSLNAATGTENWRTDDFTDGKFITNMQVIESKNRDRIHEVLFSYKTDSGSIKTVMLDGASGVTLSTVAQADQAIAIPFVQFEPVIGEYDGTGRYDNDYLIRTKDTGLLSTIEARQ